MPRICWPVLIGLVLLGGACSSVLAGTRYAVDVKGTEEGMPSVIIALTQTRDGYLWLGTMDQIVRFDGIQTTEYNEANTPGLVSSPVVSVFEDSRGNLWIGTETAGVFLVKDGKVLSLGLGRGGREGRLRSICEDAAGNVWLYTADGQLARAQDGSIRAVVAVAADVHSNCRALAVDRSGALWVGTDSRLYRVQNTPTNSVPQVFPESPMPRLDALIASKKGGFWRLVYGRIEKWDGQRVNILAPYPWQPWSTTVNAVCEDRDGNLVVGTGGEGVFWFNKDGDYVQFSSSTNGLSHSTVLSLCVDREGDLWVGTDGNGLNRIKPQAFNVLEASQGWVVKSVSADKQGGVWIGYNSERIDHWDGLSTRHYGNTQGLIEPLNVRSVFVDSEEKVWAGTFGRALLQLQNGLFLPAPGSEFIPRDKEVSALFQDHTNRLWVGTQVGLARWDGQTWKAFTTREGLSANLIRALAEDRQGNLWIGTQGGGLNLMQGERFSWFNRTNGLPSDTIWSLLCDEQGALWIGTSSGLVRYWRGAWLSFSNRIDNALTSIHYIIDDAHGQLWLGTSGGLLRVLKKDLNDLAEGRREVIASRVYAKADGLPSRECSQGSQPEACRTPDGTLWFATIKGVAYVDPKHLNQNTNAPPVLIQAVLVGGQVQNPTSLRAPPPGQVTVPPGKEGLQFEYASLNLSDPEKGRYRYRMEGHESEWTYAPGTTRWVRYSRLPPGQYRFQVSACNEDGVWNEAGASVSVAVLPPFWKTWWFLTGVGLVLLGLIAGAVHYVSTQRLQRELGALRQHEALEKERARIARDLHDQLGANLTQVALLGEMAEADKDQPGEVEAHAQQISNTARETTRALDEIVWTVNPSNDTIDGLINYICKYAQEYLAIAELKYRLEAPAELPNTPISPELRHNVFLAAKEAINNVVKHAEAKSALVRVALEPDRFVIEVEDDGRGLSELDWRKGRSGLKNMRKRMEDVGGSFQAVARADGGTRIVLSAPLQRRAAGA